MRRVFWLATCILPAAAGAVFAQATSTFSGTSPNSELPIPNSQRSNESAGFIRF